MAIEHASVTVGTTATALNSVAIGDYPKDKSIIISVPADGATVYVGSQSVTSSSYGYAIAAGSSLTADLRGNEVLFAAVASSTQAVRVLRSGF